MEIKNMLAFHAKTGADLEGDNFQVNYADIDEEVGVMPSRSPAFAM